jgi:site-specific DNA-methyltransferase (adenine-specific)
LLLASSREGDFVFDPFLGSGTTAAVARKLGRRFLGIEIDETFACLAAKRVELARFAPSIQGYSSGVFWERNSLNMQGKEAKAPLDLQPALLEDTPPYRCSDDSSSPHKSKARV